MLMQSYDDMCDNPNLTEETILHNLTSRYQQDQIFTYIGPILLAINPYQPITSLFNDSLLQDITQNALRGQLKAFPHIYMIAARAFLGIRNKQPKQSIIISGESGAGKTESTKYCMQILTKLSQKKTHSIQKKILACNPLLQAFGNSKTVRNENSSRFGKYVQILFGKDHTIKGAKIQSYLLEKSRVSMVEVNQRNFHVFYALTSSGMLGVRSASNYSYLSKSSCYVANNIDDRAFYSQIVQSLNQIGFSSTEQQKIWKLLLAILELGNIEFDDAQLQKDQNKNTCSIINKQPIPFIISALELSIKVFQTILLKTGAYKNNATKTECQVNRDTLSKAIYNCIFQFIIDKIQIALNPNNQLDSYQLIEQSNYYQVNLLDIFGFENFQKNSLQQICINFANEKLLSQYNSKIFESQIKILKQDGLEDQLKGIQEPSNQEIINTTMQIFKIINQKTINKFYNEGQIIQNIKQQYKASTHIEFQKTNPSIFKIKHSPCTIAYSIDGFKLKNQDELTKQINELCNQLFPNSSIEIVKKIKKDDKTILYKFNEKMQELVSKLSDSSNHFVRCIKPNQLKKPKFINPEYMKTQIRYLGVFETIKIRQATFPHRKLYQDFSRQYQQVFPVAKGKTHRQAAKIILKKVQALETNFLFGNNRIYLNNQLHQKLQILYTIYMNKRIKATKIIQNKFRVYHAKKLLRLAVTQLVKRAKKQKRRKCLLAFSNKCFDVLMGVWEDRLFTALRYLEIHVQDQRQIETLEQRLIRINQQQILVEEILQNRYLLSKQQMDVKIPTPLMSNLTQKQLNQQYFTSRKKPHQLSLHQYSFQNQLINQITNLENIIKINEQSHSTQRANFLKLKQQFQCKISILTQQSSNLKKNNIETTLISLKLNQQSNNLSTEILNSRSLLEQKQIELKMQRQQIQQIAQKNTFLQNQLKSTYCLIKEYQTGKAKQQQQIALIIQTKYSKLQQENKIKENQLKQDKSLIDQIQKKNVCYQKVIQQYENIIKQYKNQQEKFYREKEELHKNILQKCRSIEELKQPKNIKSKSQSPSKNEKSLLQLQQRIYQLQSQLQKRSKPSNTNSIHIVQSQVDEKDMKIIDLQSSLKQLQQKIVLLESSQKKLQAKVNQNTNRYLKETADFNNKINLANQKFKKDKFTINQLLAKNSELKNQLKLIKVKITILQKQQAKRNYQAQGQKQDLYISQGQLINFIKHYQKNLTFNEKQVLKNNILSIIDPK